MIYIQDCSAHDCYGPFPSEYDAHEFAANREISTYQMLTQDDIDNEHLIPIKPGVGGTTSRCAELS